MKTDAALQREVRRMDIQIHDGTVTLRGTVHSRHERDAAVAAAWAAPGVSQGVSQGVDELTLG